MRRILNSFKEENPELIKEPRKFSIKLIDPWRIYKNDQPAVVRNSIPLCCVQNNYFFNILQAQTNDDNRKFEINSSRPTKSPTNLNWRLKMLKHLLN